MYSTNVGTRAHDYDDGAVMKVPLAGGSPTVLAANQRATFGIAVDKTSAYFATFGATAHGGTDGAVKKLTPK